MGMRSAIKRKLQAKRDMVEKMLSNAERCSNPKLVDYLLNNAIELEADIQAFKKEWRLS